MLRSTVAGVGFAAAVFSASFARGQPIPVRVRYVEGTVLLQGQPIAFAAGKGPVVRSGQVVETDAGRAELFLAPEVVLQISEHSSVKILGFADCEIQSGSAILEASLVLRRENLVLHYKDFLITPNKAGRYRVDAGSGRLRVYRGNATITNGSNTVQAHKGAQVELKAALTASAFNLNESDAFYRWAAQRPQPGHGSLYPTVPCLAEANISNPGTPDSGSGDCYVPFLPPGP